MWHSPTSLVHRGFSLLEVLVAMAILSLILLVVAGITNQVSVVSKGATSKIEAFKTARLGFETMSRAISLATLNTYYDYYDSAYQKRTPANAATFAPAFYGRYSELEFVTGKNLVTTPRAQVTHSIFFQTPLGYTKDTDDFSKLKSTLNSAGFYIEFYNDSDERPSFLLSLLNPPPVRWRYRLIQFLQATESLSIYKAIGHTWFTDPIATPRLATRVVAENILACVICPKLNTDTSSSIIAPDYEYESRVTWSSGTQPLTMHQLPPSVEIVLIAADEIAMNRIQGTSTTEPDLGVSYPTIFQTAAELENDLKTFTGALDQKHVNYRVFRTRVGLKGAKWDN